MGWFRDNILGDDPGGGGIHTVINDPIQSGQNLVNDPLGHLKQGIEGLTLQGAATKATYDYLKPKIPDIPPGTTPSLQVNRTGTQIKIPVVYGTRKISAAICPIGVDGKDLYLIAVLCEGEISAISSVYLDDVLSTDSRYTTNSPVNVHITKYLGTSTQTADATLIAKFPSIWTSAHQLKGIAYMVVRLTYDSDIFSSLPVITAVVDGKKVYDPRENLFVYSEALTNPAYFYDGAPTLIVTDNATTALGGQLQLSRVIPQSEASVEGAWQSIAVVAGQQYTFAAFFKNYNGGPQFRLYSALGSNLVSVTFDPVTGTVITHAQGGTATLNDYGCVQVEPGVYRGWMTFTPAANEVWAHQLRYAASAGDGVHGMYYGGVQLNKGPLKAYAKTTAAAVSPVTAFSANPALCIRDYLTNSIYGKGLDSSLIDDNYIIDAAEVCDVQITEYDASPITQINQFECNAAVDTANAVIDNLKALLSSCRGFLAYFNGTYNLRVERDESSVFDFTTDNIAGAIKVANGGKQNKLNRVTLNYNNASYSSTQSYVDDTYVYDSASLRADDNGSILESEITLAAETNKYRIQWHGYYFVKRSRLQIACNLLAMPAALECIPGDIVTITYAGLGWSSKEFRITAMTLRIDCSVELSLLEHDATIYDRSLPSLIDDIAETTLPDPLTVAAPTSLTLASGSSHLLIAGDGTIHNRIYGTFTASSDMFIHHYEVGYNLPSSSDFAHLILPKDTTSFYIDGVVDNYTYTVNVEAVNSLGVKSSVLTGTHFVANIHYWTQITFTHTLLPSNQAWHDIEYGGSVFCAVTSAAFGSNVAATSPDGVTWTAQTLPSAQQWNALAWNGTVFCAIGGNSTVAATSPDGATWTARVLPSSVNWTDIAWNGSVFCAIAFGSNVAATSPDGITWTARTLPSVANWQAIAWNGTVFCAVAYNSTAAATSPDGITWTARTLPSSQHWRGIAWNGTVFCAIADYTTTAATSPDGITWTARTMPLAAFWNAIAWNGYVFCVTEGVSSVAATSPDGITWKQRPMPTAGYWSAIASDGQIFCAVSGNLSNSSALCAASLR